MTLAEAYQRLDARVMAMKALGIVPPAKMQARMMRPQTHSRGHWSTTAGIAHLDAQRMGHIGLRFVGQVVPEFKIGRDWSWTTGDRRNHLGWHMTIDGDVGIDGFGLCCGVVYQLPGRKGVTRFVPGYIMDGEDKYPTVNFFSIFEEHISESEAFYECARPCAREADHMAQLAAEEAREYYENQKDTDAA